MPPKDQKFFPEITRILSRKPFEWNQIFNTLTFYENDNNNFVVTLALKMY